MKVWCNAQLSNEAESLLREGLKGHDLVFAGSLGNNLAVQGFSDEMAGAEIAFGQPDPKQILDSPTLRFVQLTSAGYTRYDTLDFDRGVKEKGLKFCNSSSVYDEPCAQHLLAFMLAQARQIPEAIMEQQSEKRWIFDRLRPIMRVLKDEKVLILGYGAIARRLIELLGPFHLDIVAVRRRPRGDESVPTFPITHLPGLLSDADHIINILPANASTNGLIDADCFAAMKPRAVFYNVGRGTTVDQTALIQSLKSDQLASAYLDVTEPEPLPGDDPLWQAPNCFITPHVAGGLQHESVSLVSHFLANLSKFEAGQALDDLVFG